MTQQNKDRIFSILKKIKRKRNGSRFLFISMSLISIIISASSIILNLYAIRYNVLPVQTMSLFVAIAVISSVITFLVTIQSFFNITESKNKLEQSVEKRTELKNKIEESKEVNETLVNELFDTYV